MTIRISVFAERGSKPYTGFIYLWRNSLTNMSYVGSHMGHIDDGYIGSGTHFKNSYKKNKMFFKRRILEFVCGDYFKLIDRENYWLSLIEKKQKFSKYYNKSYNSTGLHTYNYDSKKAMSFSKIGRKWYNDGLQDYLLDKSSTLVDTLNPGRISSGGKLGCNKNSIWVTNGTEEKKIFDVDFTPDGWVLGRAADLKEKMKNKVVSETTKELIRFANLGKRKSMQSKKKMSESKKGRKWYHKNGISILVKDSPGEGWELGRK